MVNDKYVKAGLIIIFSSLLFACSSVEYKSERIAKKPLPSVSAQHSASKNWANNTDKGSKNLALKLLIAQSENELIVSDSVGNIKALNKQTGKQVWQSHLKQNITAGPSANNKIVTIATEVGGVIAVASSNGNTIWQKKINSEILAAPLVTQDRVYVHSLDGGIFALDVATGKEIWHYSSVIPTLMLRSSSRPVIYNDLVIVGTASGKLLAINKNNGALIWAEDVAAPKGKSEMQRMNDISSDPVVDGNLVYVVNYQGKLAVFDLATGNKEFDKDLSSFAGLAVDNEKIYISTADGEVCAIEKRTGNTKWMQANLQGRFLTKPVVFKNYILLGDEEGFLHWLNKENGEIINRYLVDSSGIVAHPVVDDKQIFVLGQSGKIISLSIN